jgi:hypothetical protein
MTGVRGSRVFVLLGIVSFLSVATVAMAAGRICLAPLADDAKALDHDMPGGVPQKRTQLYEFSVRIDDREAVPVPRKSESSRFIDDLDPLSRHLIAIQDGGKVIESFWFTFEQRGGSDLCLTYTPWYQTWQLEPPRRKSSECRCWR